MGNKTLNSTLFLDLLMVLCFFAAAIYLFVWISLIFSLPMCEKLDLLFGAIPIMIDEIFFFQVDINGTSVPMGYVIASIISAGFGFSIVRMKNGENDAREKSAKVSKQFFENQKKIPRQKTKRVGKVNSKELFSYFFALFEMNFEFLNSFDKSDDDLERLKKEYFKVLVDNLQEKYPCVQFVVTNKIFIISDDFAIFDEFLCDIIKIFAVFQELNYEKLIGSSFLISFDANETCTNPKKEYNILTKINNLSNYNRVIVSDKFAKKYKYSPSQKFASILLESSRMILDSNTESFINLYFLEMNQ